MANYNEISVEGTSYIRSRRVICDNHLPGPKMITFHEEQVFNFEGRQIKQDLGYITEPFNEDTTGTQFDLLDPVSGTKISTVTYGHVYAILHSLYIHLALKRDAAQQEGETPEP